VGRRWDNLPELGLAGPAANEYNPAFVDLVVVLLLSTDPSLSFCLGLVDITRSLLLADKGRSGNRIADDETLFVLTLLAKSFGDSAPALVGVTGDVHEDEELAATGNGTAGPAEKEPGRTSFRRSIFSFGMVAIDGLPTNPLHNELLYVLFYDNSIKKVSSLLVNSLIITDFLVKSDFDQFPSLSRTGTHTHTHSSVTRTHTADTVSQCTHTHTHSTVLQQWCEIQSESERESTYRKVEKCWISEFDTGVVVEVVLVDRKLIRGGKAACEVLL
jgi:hypothetical protein